MCFFRDEKQQRNDKPTFKFFFADRSNREAPIPCADFYTVASKCVIGREDAWASPLQLTIVQLSLRYIFGGPGY
jgi:hypothetical protein